jgi:transcription initiation factor TFIIF subunit beta
MADTLIKPDPDTKGASPGPLPDEDIYEDAGDLEFNGDSAWQSLYLARVPKGVWEAWSKLDDDAEIQLGIVRKTISTSADGKNTVWESPPPKPGDGFTHFECRKNSLCFLDPTWQPTKA